MTAVLRTMPDAEPDRRRYLGGSDAASILGIAAYGRTPLTCYLAKIGELDTVMDPDKRKFLDRRKRWEGPIFQMLREEFDAQIVGENQRYIDPVFDFMAAEIDFEWIDADGRTQNGEIKTVSPFAHGEKHGWGDAGTADIPIHYAAQVMWGLMITGRQVCIVAAMVGLDNMIFYRVERDEETIATMREAAIDFWVNHVQARIPPEPISLSDVMKLTLRVQGKPVVLDETLLDKVQKIREIRDMHKALEFESQELEFQVFDFIRKQWGAPAAEEEELPPENAALLFEGVKVATWGRQRGASLDQKLLKIEHPEIIKQYQREYFFRTLRVAAPH